MTPTDYEEKRNFIRMTVNTPATVTLEKDGSVYTGLCKDVSGAGMQVELDHALELDTVLEVNIEGAGQGQAPLKAKAKVARVEAGPAGQSIIGLQVIELLC